MNPEGDPSTMNEFEAILPSFHVSLASDMQNTFKSACHCVSILERWSQATSRHPLANAIIERTQAQFVEFFHLLSTSKDVAQMGIKLIENISSRYGTLLESTKDTIQLNKFRHGVIPEIHDAQDQSSVTKANFRDIMKTFIEAISRDIATTIATIQEEKDQFDQEIAAGTQILNIKKNRGTEVKVVNVNKERECLLNAKEALVMLADLFSEVGQGLANFIKFWMSVDMSLETLEKQIEEMHEFRKLRLEIAKGQWEETGAIYRHYVLQIGFLCQMIPPMRASPTSNVKPVHELRDDICDIDPKLKIILEGLQPGQVATEIKGMVELACRCIAILEPWNQARSKQPAAEKIIKRVQEDFNKFFNLLHRSKEVARSGCKGMQDLSSACFQLSRPTKETSQLKVLVEEISLPLRRADEQRKLIHTKFREARIRVIEISELMPSAMARIENERNKEIADTESRKEGLERQLGVLQSYASMPLALEETLRARSVKKNEARELHTRRCEDALQMLETVPDFLIQLEDCIAKFIRFWWRIEEIVRNVRERIADLGNFPMTWSLRMELAKQAWEEAVMAYHDYIMMIEYLCIIAPPVGTPPSSGRKIMGFLH